MSEPEWEATVPDLLFYEFKTTAETFSSLVIFPACAALDENSSPRHEDTAMEAYLRAVSSRESYKALALSLAGLWESQFREHLRKTVAALLKDQKLSSRVKGCQLDELERIFQKLRKFSLYDIAEYKKIRTLISIANAARHGDGRSSEEAYKIYPQYFSIERPHAGFYSYFLHGGLSKNAVRYIDIKRSHIDEFSGSVISFWGDLERRLKEVELRKSQS